MFELKDKISSLPSLEGKLEESKGSKEEKKSQVQLFGHSCCAIGLGFPRPQTGARIPMAWKRGLRGPETPISLRPHAGRRRELSVKKSPFPFGPLKEKGGCFSTENSLFHDERTWGLLDPENLFSRKWGFGLLSGVRGIPILNLILKTPRETKEKRVPKHIKNEGFRLLEFAFTSMFSVFSKGRADSLCDAPPPLPPE